MLKVMAHDFALIGEAIFATRTWEAFGEGHKNFNNIDHGSAADIRFTLYHLYRIDEWLPAIYGTLNQCPSPGTEYQSLCYPQSGANRNTALTPDNCKIPTSPCNYPHRAGYCRYNFF